MLSESESDFDLVLMLGPAELVVSGTVWVSSLNLTIVVSTFVFLVTSGLRCTLCLVDMRPFSIFTRKLACWPSSVSLASICANSC